ncbi:MAG TPA: diguanylate cyclase [Gemmatimonadales bacterium]|jgi:two-component system response regulator MprA|nr:diguanylate cyclase [Gemmatimonadales bacterium]
MRTKAASTRPVVVLIASKQEWTSRSLESILVPRGYAVLKTYTSAQVLRQAQTDPPDAMIIDEELPDGEGRELCQRLRARGLITLSTPVFLLLQRPPTRRDRLAALNARAWACLGDPLDADELLALLAAFVPAKLDADQARTDGLVDEATGVYNVRGLTRRAHELAAQAARRHAALACVLLAPDRPPGPEDAGVTDGAQEAVVRRIAAALKASARHSDAIGRLGPGAFAVVAVDTDAAQARQMAERLAAAILAEAERPADPLPPFRLRAGCHGVPDFRTAAIDTVELMMRATKALERARANPPDAWLQVFEDDAPVSPS